MATYKKQLLDKDGNVIYPDVGLNLDDVVYSDDPGESIDNVIDPNSYSTEEKWTGGYWIDNKPIYKKTINFGTLPNATNKKVPHGITNLGTVVRWEGMTTYSGDSVQRPLPFVPTVSSGYVLVEFEPSNIAVYAGSDRTAFSAIITMYYTKSS